MDDQLLNQVREEIAKDNLKNAFSILVTNVPKDTKCFEEVLLLKGSLDYIMTRENKGLIYLNHSRF